MNEEIISQVPSPNNLMDGYLGTEFRDKLTLVSCSSLVIKTNKKMILFMILFLEVFREKRPYWGQKCSCSIKVWLPN